MTIGTLIDRLGGRRPLCICFVVLFSGTIGGATGPLLAGKLFDMSGNYDAIFMILTAFGVIGLLLASALTPIDGKIAATARKSMG